MKLRDTLGQFRSKHNRLGTLVKTVGITIFVVGFLNGLIIGSNFVSAKVGWIENWHFPKAQAYVEAPISSGGLDLNRPQEVQALINHFADIRKGDDSFKAETNKEVSELMKQRDLQAVQDALTIIKVQYDVQLSELVKAENQ